MNTSGNKNQTTHSMRKERDKEKDLKTSSQHGNQTEESKTQETGQGATRELHGPSRDIFIRSQKIPKKECYMEYHWGIYSISYLIYIFINFSKTL